MDDWAAAGDRQIGALEKLVGQGTERDRMSVIAACTKARNGYPHAAGTAAFAAANGDWPLTRWIAVEVHKRKCQETADPVNGQLPLIVGITGPQGCGKTTLCASLLAGLGALSVKAAAASMDDFYLPTKLLPPVILGGETSPRTKLPCRGPPGTHDLTLCRGVLQCIKERKPNILLPKYDKSQMNGTGDRSSEEVPLDATDLDVFLLEGWMLGFRHVDPSVLADWSASEQQQELHQINESLKVYEPLYELIDLWLIVKVETPTWVYRWRRQQEE
ncbi:glycerate kinase, putative [Eimeria acervulina]|uniref:Glycerate kinase, putative n=1 Tax=Eimeria acervulina TaxID=5801 RepID=U6GG37_EIMAC|nr:glycerate kinase, putative [Eimeria acervulina]CDI77539.1 glycerate kinase, putative [Eimeria acervulina]